MEFDVTLGEFLDGYWETRMNEVFASRAALDEEDQRRTREVSVILDATDNNLEKILINVPH